MLNLGVETQCIASLPFYTEQARETQSIASLPFYAEHVRQPSSIEQPGPAGISSTICSTSPALRRKVLRLYAEHVTQPSSIEQLGPAGISSTICSTTSGITGSMFLPPWFSTVNLTACDAACVRR